jgi:hypothetical protein
VIDPSSIIADATRRQPGIRNRQAGRYVVFSYIYQGSNVIESATNLTGADGCGTARHSPDGHLGYVRESVHSEVRCYRKARGLLNRRKSWGIIVIRIGSHGSFLLAKPCVICQAYLRSVGCAHIYYSEPQGITKLY